MADDSNGGVDDAGLFGGWGRQAGRFVKALAADVGKVIGDRSDQQC